MLVVYWGRWADSTGDVSRWSKPCVARVEGWSTAAGALPPALTGADRAALPAGEAEARAGQRALTGRVETRYVFIHAPTTIAGELPEASPPPAQRLPQLPEGIDAEDVVQLLGQRLLEAA
jgi:hypothetical protein